MASGKHVACAAVASIVGLILASQYCASQMTGNSIHCRVVTIHVHNARVHKVCHAARLFGPIITFPSKLVYTPVAYIRTMHVKNVYISEGLLILGDTNQRVGRLTK